MMITGSFIMSLVTGLCDTKKYFKFSIVLGQVALTETECLSSQLQLSLLCSSLIEISKANWHNLKLCKENILEINTFNVCF